MHFSKNKLVAEDLTGKQFGRLTVLRRGPNGKSGYVRWVCVCSCGNSTISSRSSLKKGEAKSCGCLVKERNRELRLKFKDPTKSALSRVFEKNKA